MRTDMRKNRRSWVILVVCVTMVLSMLLCGYGGYNIADQRVFDDADLLTETEEEQLQQDIVSRIEKLALDISVVTTSDAQGKSTMAYADDFYDEHGFGYGDEYGPGILMLIDMDHREVYISTAGQAIADFTDWEIERMLDAIYNWLVEGEYYGACQEFLDVVEIYADNEETAQNGYYDQESDTFVEYTPQEIQSQRRKEAVAQVLSPGGIFSRLMISVVIGAVGVLIVRIHVNKNKIPGGRIYMKPGSEYVRERYDFKTNTTVTKRHVPRNDGGGSHGGGGGGSRGHSSSHRSSSGRSHGGGGRRF